VHQPCCDVFVDNEIGEAHRFFPRECDRWRFNLGSRHPFQLRVALSQRFFWQHRNLERGRPRSGRSTRHRRGDLVAQGHRVCDFARPNLRPSSCSWISRPAADRRRPCGNPRLCRRVDLRHPCHRPRGRLTCPDGQSPQPAVGTAERHRPRAEPRPAHRPVGELHSSDTRTVHRTGPVGAAILRARHRGAPLVTSLGPVN